MATDDPTTDGDYGPDPDQKIEQIVEGFLEELRSGGDSESQAENLIAQFPELAPKLEQRLKFFAALFQAVSSAAVDATPESPSDFGSDPGLTRGDDLISRGEQETIASAAALASAAIRLNCPHCGNNLLVVTERATEVTCGSCGSAVSVGLGDLPTADIVPLPKKIGRFEVRRVLGQGAFGVVYLANDPQLNRMVAVKIPRNGFFSTEREEQRFIREARSAARLSHPNVVQVHEVSDALDSPFIVSEFIDGLTLADIASLGTLSFKDAATLVIQVCEGVEYAHSQGVVHRDLKPGNILVNNNQHAYVTDFGLARYDEAEITMTIDGVVLGTPAYMPPEQAEGRHGDVDAQSDVYSIGVILYCLFCKELPFHGTKRMLLHQVLHDEPRDPRKLNDRIPKDLETITLTAMSKEKAKRYSSAKDLGDELRRWLRNEPIHARPISSAARLARWCKRKPMVAALSSMIVLLLVGGAIAATIWAIRESGLKTIASNNEALAVEKKNESDLRLQKLFLQNGTHYLNQNDLIRSNAWFAQAAALEKGDLAVHRTRLGMIADQSPTLQQIWLADSPVYNLQFSDDGQRLFSGAGSGQTTVFNTINGNQLLSKKQSKSIGLASLFPDGKRYLAIASPNNANVWDIDSNKRVASFDHGSVIWTAALSDDANFVATGGSEKTMVWNAVTGEKLAELPAESCYVVKLQFLKDSNKLLVVTQGRDGFAVQLWNVAEKKVVVEGMSHQKRIVELKVTADQKTLATAANDGIVRFWDLATGQQMGADATERDEVSFIEFTENDQELVVVTLTGDIVRRDVNSKYRKRVGRRQIANSTTSVMDPQRRLIASGTDDGSVHIYWRKYGSKPLCTVHNGLSISSVAFHPTRPIIAVGSTSGVIQLWNLATCIPESTTLNHNDEVLMAMFTPDGGRVVTCSRDGTGRIWDAKTGKPVGEPLGHASEVIALAISSNNQLIATGGADSLVKIWDGFTGKQVGSDLPHDAYIERMAFSPDNKLLAVGCSDGSVKVWETDRLNVNPNEKFTVQHDKKIMHIEFDKDSKRFATTSGDHSARCWDALTGLPITPPLEHSHDALHCIFLPGNRLLTTSADNTAKVWDISATPTVTAILEHDTLVAFATLSPSGEIITSDWSGTFTVWDPTTFQPIRRVRNESISVLQSVTLNPSGSLIVIGGGEISGKVHDLGNGGAMLWEMATGLPVSPLLSQRARAEFSQFSPSGQTVLSSSLDGTAKIWDVKSWQGDLAIFSRYQQLVSQLEFSDSGEVVMMSPSKLVSEFNELKMSNSEFFQSSANQESRWNDFLKELDTSRKNENK